VRTPVILFLLALVARLVVAAGFPDPAYPDSFYYVDVARQLAAGNGFNVDFIWIFPEVGGVLPADPALPVPSNAHWMPLASIIQVPFILLLGPTTLASLLPSALIGATMAPLAWAIARDARLGSFVAVGAGLFAAIPGLSLVYMSQPENFSLFGPLVATALLLAGRGLRGHPRAFIAAGLFAGLAALSRTEGGLVLAAMLAGFAWNRVRARLSASSGSSLAPRVPIAAAAGAVVLFILVVTPWYLRQLSEFGALSPSTSTGKVLFIRDFSEWNSITIPATLDHLLGMGLGPLLATRATGLTTSLVLFAVLVMAGVLVPFLVVGAWQRRRDVSFTPAFGYAALLLGFCTILTPIHVPGGQLFHSAVGLAPHAYVLTMHGAVLLAAWLGRRWSRWDPEVTARVLIIGLVGFGIAAAVWSTADVHASWAVKRTRAQVAAAALNEAGAGQFDRVMSIDAAGMRYWSGRGGVVLLNDPVETVEAVARAYDIRWLVLERADGVPLTRQIMVAGQRPAWVGPAAWTNGDVTVYPVCTGLGDPRCQGGGVIDDTSVKVPG
jgi:hypothetical protein